MQLSGTTDFSCDASALWHTLHDTDVLVRTIPGCKSMAPIGDGEYRVALSLGVASIKGDYEGLIRVKDIEFPCHYELQAEGAGNPGYVNMTVECRLEPRADGTRMSWSCDAEVGGLIASIGGRVLTGISKFMANQFFKSAAAEGKSA